MTAFDTDVLTLLLLGNAAYQRRFKAVPHAERFVTVVNCEEALRGRLDAIRQADTKKRIDLFVSKYDLLRSTLGQLARLQVLPYDQRAHDLFLAWRAAKIRVGTQDLRIGAVCVAHDAELASRNQRDFDRVPGLKLSVWN